MYCVGIVYFGLITKPNYSFKPIHRNYFYRILDLIRLRLKKQEKCHKSIVKVLKDYLTEKDGDFSDVSELDEASTSDVLSILRKLYGEIRKADGSLYAKTSMVTLRFGLQKHF